MSKTALVTGGGRGIGAGIVEKLAADGWNVAFCGRKEESAFVERCRELGKRYGVKAVYFRCDVSARGDREMLLTLIRNTFGSLEALVNNAGVAGQALFQDVTDEMWQRYFSTNVDGAYHAIQAVLPAMLHAHEGCILNISSIWGQRGASCEVTYSCTKAALIGLTRSLASELAPTHIRVNCIAPGVIKTDMLDALPPEVLPQLAEETPLRRLGTPEDIAHAAAFLASEKADFITGQVLTVDGGFIL